MLFAEVQFARVYLSTRDLGTISRGTAYASLEVTQEESSTTAILLYACLKHINALNMTWRNSWEGICLVFICIL